MEGKKGRKTHVRRVYADGDTPTGKDNDTWVDIEVIDELWTVGSGSTVHARKPGNPFLREAVKKINEQIQGQEIHYFFNMDGVENEPERKIAKKKISHPDDRSRYIEVEITTELRVRFNFRGQTWYRRIGFNNGDNSTKRQTRVRRVIHVDVPDEKLDAGKNPPEDPQEYLNACDLKNTDKEQYIEIEIIEEQHHKHNEENVWVDTRLEWCPENSILLEKLPSGNAEAQGQSGKIESAEIDPPWRLDPLQTIVNINWGEGLAVEFFDKQNGGNEPPIDGSGSGGSTPGVGG